MPSGLIEQQNGMCARRDVEGDLLEVHAHRLAVAAGHDDAGGFTFGGTDRAEQPRSEEHTSELQSLMRISYAVFCLKQKKPPATPRTNKTTYTNPRHTHNDSTQHR